jgi:branched-chain amino acid transport system substrate-binding protein
VRRAWLWVAALCWAGLAACGPLQSGPGGPSLPGSVPRTLKIGLSAPFEGLYRPIGYQALYGVRLAVRERNAAGGVGNALIELVALNDFNQASEAAVQAQKLVIDPLVLGVVGGLRPEAALAALPVYQAAELAFLSPTPSDLLVAHGLTETLAAGLSNVVVAQAAADLLVSEWGAQRLGLLQGTGSAERALGAALDQALAARGVELTVTTGWQTELLSAEALFVAAEVREGAAWMAQTWAAGYERPMAGGPALHSPLLPLLAEGAARDAVVLSGLAPPPDSERWQEAFREVSGGTAPSPMAWWAYGAAIRLLDAVAWDIRQGGGPTRSGVLAQVAATPCSHDVVYRYQVGQAGEFELVGR